MKRMTKIFGIIALAAVIGFSMAACSRGGGSGGGGGRSATPAPESDFTTELTRDSAGVIIKKYNGNAKVINIPATIQGLPVREIGDGAFKEKIGGVHTITTVIIPEGVTGIKRYAFEYCENLTSVTLPSTLTEIEFSAFRYTGLASFPDTWPANVTTIDSSMFENTKIRNLVISEGITEIDRAAFSNIDDLVSVTLPSTIKTINNGAFRGSKNIDLQSQAAIRAVNPQAEF